MTTHNKFPGFIPYKDSASLYHTVLEDTSSPENFLEIASTFLEKGDIDGALACCDMALRIDQEYAKAYFCLAKIYHLSERPEQALQYLLQAKTLAPDEDFNLM
jgi:tetratricopeptide (TPR) repeat protein